MHIHKSFFLLGALWFPVCSLSAIEWNELSVTQKSQLGLTTAKTLAAVVSDACDVGHAKKGKMAAVLRCISRLANGATKLLDCSHNRDTYSKILHGNAAAWQCATDVKEFLQFDKWQKEYGDKIPEEVLKEHYYLSDLVEPDEPDEFSEFDEFNEFNYFDDVEEFEPAQPYRKKLWRDTFRLLTRIVDFGLSAGLILKLGDREQKCWLRIGQAVCDLLTRALSTRKTKGTLGAVEAVSTSLPLSYDGVRGVYKLFHKPDLGPQRTGRVFEGQDEDGEDNQCPICFEVDGREAMRLPCCGRELCENCLGTLPRRENINLVGGVRVGEGFSCPYCRQGYIECGKDEEGHLVWRRFRPLVDEEGVYEEIEENDE